MTLVWDRCSGMGTCSSDERGASSDDDGRPLDGCPIEGAGTVSGSFPAPDVKEIQKHVYIISLSTKKLE